MADTSKKMQADKALILSIIKYLMITAIVVVVLFLLVKLFWILIPVIIGFVLASGSNGFSALCYRIVRRKRPKSPEEGKDSKGYRAFKLINFTLLLLVFLGFLVFIVIAAIAQVQNLMDFINNFLKSGSPTFDIISQITSWLNQLSDRLGGILPESMVQQLNTELLKMQKNILDALPQLTSALFSSLVGFLSNLPNLIFQAIVVVMSGYYFITDRIVIGKFIRELLPSEVFVKKTVDVITKVSHSMFRVLGGYIVIMTVTFFEALIGLSIIQMPYVIIIALVVTVIDLLPAVGASACFYPIAIYMFTQGRIVHGFIALAFVLIMTLVRTTLEPKVVGTAMKLHPLATLVAMILGVAAFGFTGFIGGPILVVLVLGIMESFGFKVAFREWLGKLLNKVATTDVRKDAVCEPTAAKVKHIVVWQLKEEANGRTREQNALEIRERLLALKPLIPELLSIEVGIDTKFDSTAYDCVLVTTFASYEDLNTYKYHPSHQEVARWIGTVASSRTAIDFDL